MVGFNDAKDLDVSGRKLVEMLSFVESDVRSTLEVLYKYYRCKSNALAKKLPCIKERVGNNKEKI